MTKYISNSLEETQKITDDFIETLLPNPEKAVVVGLSGNLGAGKTTLTQYLAKALGVGETVTSPTFVIEKVYELTGQKFTHLIHIDAYRLEKSDELIHLGWQDIISDKNNLIIIEWPERVADIMPEHTKVIISHISENKREIEILK